MLNRRILRIKAMQSLYAFQKSEESNYHLGIAQIETSYRALLMEKGMEFRLTLQDQEQESIKRYQQFCRKGKAEEVLASDPTYIGKIAWEAIGQYRVLAEREHRTAAQKMVADTELLFTKYLRILQLLVTLADRIKFVQREREANKNAITTLADCARFFDCELLAAIRNQPEIVKENYHWDPDLVASWSVNLRKDEGFLKLLAESPEGLEQDKEIALYIIREFLFNQEPAESYFEENDMSWTENKSIIKSMLAKTIKGVEADGSMEVLTLSKNWEDDRDFFKQLFKATLENDEAWEERIVQRTKRWSSDRIATVDKLLLKMALSEMVVFPSIPVKVTINEYIEISKTYSTPKSWQFMNGLLDAISGDMMEAGLIKKSGRGLLDNK